MGLSGCLRKSIHDFLPKKWLQLGSNCAVSVPVALKTYQADPVPEEPGAPTQGAERDYVRGWVGQFSEDPRGS